MVEREINWEWTDSAVEMIPFGLLTGFYGKKEIRITKLAEEPVSGNSGDPCCLADRAENRIFHQLCGGSTAGRLPESGACAVLPV